MMVLAECTRENVLLVASHMRQSDLVEISACRDVPVDRLPVELTETVMACGPLKWVAGRRDPDGDLVEPSTGWRYDPIAVFGAHECWHGMWGVYLFATDAFQHIGKELTRWGLRSMLPALKRLGARRLEARSIEGHDEAHRWLVALGASREATLEQYGRGGETFHIYSRLLGESSRVQPA